jgi:hypothetical protein
MAIIEIPTQQNLSAWEQRTTLDGSDYLLNFAWNGREAAWYLSFSDAAGVPLVTGIKLVSNRPLLNRFRYVQGLPPGNVMAVDLSGQIAQAGYTDLSAGVSLVYFDLEELSGGG